MGRDVLDAGAPQLRPAELRDTRQKVFMSSQKNRLCARVPNGS